MASTTPMKYIIRCFISFDLASLEINADGSIVHWRDGVTSEVDTNSLVVAALTTLCTLSNIRTDLRIVTGVICQGQNILHPNGRSQPFDYPGITQDTRRQVV